MRAPNLFIGAITLLLGASAAHAAPLNPLSPEGLKAGWSQYWTEKAQMWKHPERGELKKVTIAGQKAPVHVRNDFFNEYQGGAYAAASLYLGNKGEFARLGKLDIKLGDATGKGKPDLTRTLDIRVGVTPHDKAIKPFNLIVPVGTFEVYKRAVYKEGSKHDGYVKGYGPNLIPKGILADK